MTKNFTIKWVKEILPNLHKNQFASDHFEYIYSEKIKDFNPKDHGILNEEYTVKYTDIFEIDEFLTDLKTIKEFMITENLDLKVMCTLFFKSIYSEFPLKTNINNWLGNKNLQSDTLSRFDPPKVKICKNPNSFMETESEYSNFKREEIKHEKINKMGFVIYFITYFCPKSDCRTESPVFYRELYFIV